MKNMTASAGCTLEHVMLKLWPWELVLKVATPHVHYLDSMRHVESVEVWHIPYCRMSLFFFLIDMLMSRVKQASYSAFSTLGFVENTSELKLVWKETSF